MSVIVLDASVFASWVLPTQATEASRRLLRRARDFSFHVPHIFPVEVHNLLLSAERRNGWRIADSERALSLLREFELHVELPLDDGFMDEAFRLARAERLSMYDGMYLLLAIDDYAQLASRDGALVDAAKRRSVQVIDCR